MSAVDFLKREITVGSHVVYAVRRFSDITFKRMKVLQIVQEGEQPFISGLTPEGRRVQVRNLNTVIVIPDEVPA